MNQRGAAPLGARADGFGDRCRPSSMKRRIPDRPRGSRPTQHITQSERLYQRYSEAQLQLLLGFDEADASSTSSRPYDSSRKNDGGGSSVRDSESGIRSLAAPRCLPGRDQSARITRRPSESPLLRGDAAPVSLAVLWYQDQLSTSRGRGDGLGASGSEHADSKWHAGRPRDGICHRCLCAL